MISSKRPKEGIDSSNASQEKNSVIKLPDGKNQSSSIFKFGKGNLNSVMKIPNNEVPFMRESSSLTNLKQATEQKILMAKSASLGNLQHKVTKFSFDLRLPGKKAQCIKKLKEYFTKQIEMVLYDNSDQ
jgi:hypothetical protein